MHNVITNPMLYKIIISVVIAVAAIFLIAVFKRLFKKFVDTKYGKGSDAAVVKGSIPSVFFDISKIVVILIAVTWILQINGIDVGSIVTGLGVAGIIVGFALQDVLKDVIMGLHILSDHFFDIGDVIKYNDFEGIVTDFNLRTTKIRSTVDGSTIVVSNRNISEINRCSMLTDIDVPLSYTQSLSDVDSVMKRVCERASELPYVEKCIFKGTQAFEDSCIRYKVRFFVKPTYRFDTKRAVNRIIQEELERDGIVIPYNQLDIHLDGSLNSNVG